MTELQRLRKKWTPNGRKFTTCRVSKYADPFFCSAVRVNDGYRVYMNVSYGVNTASVDTTPLYIPTNTITAEEVVTERLVTYAEEKWQELYPYLTPDILEKLKPEFLISEYEPPTTTLTETECFI